jgi:hypothetical protein
MMINSILTHYGELYMEFLVTDESMLDDHRDLRPHNVFSLPIDFVFVLYTQFFCCLDLD